MSSPDTATILLVEDNARDLDLTIRALRQGNLANDIAVARDGEEALEYVFCRGKYSQREFGDAPRLILLDLKLPKIDGLQVLREIKNNELTRPIPVVVLTSSRQQQDLIHSYALGVNAFIQKPVNFDDFRTVVGQVGLFWLVVNQPPPKEMFEREVGK